MELDERGLSQLYFPTKDDGSAIQAELKKLTGASSVPRVFIDGNFVGGCDGRHFIILIERGSRFAQKWQVENDPQRRWYQDLNAKEYTSTKSSFYVGLTTRRLLVPFSIFWYFLLFPVPPSSLFPSFAFHFV